MRGRNVGDRRERGSCGPHVCRDRLRHGREIVGLRPSFSEPHDFGVVGGRGAFLERDHATELSCHIRHASQRCGEQHDDGKCGGHRRVEPPHGRLVHVNAEGEDTAAGESDDQPPRHRWREAFSNKMIEEKDHHAWRHPLEDTDGNRQRRALHPSPPTRGQ